MTHRNVLRLIAVLLVGLLLGLVMLLWFEMVEHTLTESPTRDFEPTLTYEVQTEP